ncbi:MAG TPA: alpha/beta fold hydrolase [Ensifer sp.]|nr:alpha/beta fold hydrolase [Ensifer sp.]
MSLLPRLALASLASLAFMTAAYSADPKFPPIVFVHGNGDTAALWMTQFWRFESNGYPEDHLFAVDIPHPTARADDNTQEANRSSTTDAAQAVAAEVDEALKATGADKVVLVANSRGCQTARNYVKNFGGAAKVERMVLGGCVHHGVFVLPNAAQGSEFNGAAPFLKNLSAEPEVPQGIPVTVIRSDKFDLYSQPEGKYVGMAGKSTGITYESQELKGADNRVIPGADHRETAYSKIAFEIIYQAITGEKPGTHAIVAEENPVLSGKITGYENGAATNLPVPGAKLAIYATDPKTGERFGPPVYEKTVGADGVWGDFHARPSQTYEFDIKAEGYPETRYFRGLLPRSFRYMDLRLQPAPAQGNFVFVKRPRGYFGPDDQATANGAPLPGIDPNDPVPHVASSNVPVAGDKPESVTAVFNGETIVGRYDPALKDAATYIEFTD